MGHHEHPPLSSTIDPDHVARELDKLVAKARELGRSRESSLVVTKLEEAQLWLTKVERSVRHGGSPLPVDPM